MKKTLSVFLALLMVLLPMTAYAEENPTVVTVNGDGTFDDGTQTQTLRNRTPVETGADAKGYMEYTLHTLRVTGATGATTFTIATSLDGTGAVTGSNSCRMWFDDLRIERE